MNLTHCDPDQDKAAGNNNTFDFITVVHLHLQPIVGTVLLLLTLITVALLIITPTP